MTRFFFEYRGRQDAGRIRAPRIITKEDVMQTIDEFAIGQMVIVRARYAGVWCGKLVQKAGRQVILEGARRMWSWWCRESISLSGVAVYGIRPEKSKIAPPVPQVWVEAIEIIPVSGDPLKSIMEADIAPQDWR